MANIIYKNYFRLRQEANSYVKDRRFGDAITCALYNLGNFPTHSAFVEASFMYDWGIAIDEKAGEFRIYYSPSRPNCDHKKRHFINTAKALAPLGCKRVSWYSARWEIIRDRNFAYRYEAELVFRPDNLDQLRYSGSYSWLEKCAEDKRSLVCEGIRELVGKALTMARYGLYRKCIKASHEANGWGIDRFDDSFIFYYPPRFSGIYKEDNLGITRTAFGPHCYKVEESKTKIFGVLNQDIIKVTFKLEAVPFGYGLF